MPVETTATASSTRFGQYMAHCARISIGFGEVLVKGIPAEKFAHMPIPGMNHPAFCLGHLSLYPNRVLKLIGRDDLVMEKPGYNELFQQGVECVEKEGMYPPKNELVSYYLERYRTLADALEQTPDEVFHRENPAGGKLAENFPTLGMAAIFLANNHQMCHLGQISAWRRAIGMGRAF